MKRFICIFTALALFLCAFAEPLTDSMAALTSNVKAALGIGDDYDSFDVSSSGDLRYMYWYREDGGCSVTAGRDGTVYSFYMYDSEDYVSSQGFGARFPLLATDALTAAAESFLSRVITGEGWGYALDEVTPALASDSSRAYVSGYLTLYGIRTDISVSLSLNADTGKVLSYFRSDAYMTRGSMPAQAEAQVDETQALTLLKQNAVLKCVYAVTEEGQMARLVYEPVRLSDLMISAATGEPVSDNAEVNKGETDNTASARAMAADYSLTGYELEAINAYDGALDIPELEQILRENAYLGLTDEYLLEESGYYTEDSQPRAQLTFDNGSVTRTARVDALTGRLIRLYSYYNGEIIDPDEPVADTEAGSALAAAFLNDCYPEYAAQTELTGSRAANSVSTVCCTFTRVYDGYPYEDNAVSVTVDPVSGTVCGFNYTWDSGLEFYSAPETPVSEAEALAALTESAAAVLRYASVYNEDTGAYDLTLVWALEGASDAWALDAETGEQYTYTVAQNNVYTYDDLDGVPYADEIITLGKYGIGAEGVDFTAACTPEFLMTLILQAAGYGITDDVASAFAQRYGTVPADTVTRAELARIVCTAAGYGNALAISGIYTLDVTDWESVTDSEQSACAIGCALGYILPDESGCINAASPATAAEAAHAIYALLGGK